MSQTEQTSVRARAKAIRTSPRKLNLVAESIRGKDASIALTELANSPRRIAIDVRKVLQAAISNAENNNGMDVDRLYVREAWVGRAFVLKRMHTRGRGRSAGIEKPFSNLTVVVGERDEDYQRRNKAKPQSTNSKKAQPAGRKARTVKVEHVHGPNCNHDHDHVHDHGHGHNHDHAHEKASKHSTEQGHQH